MRVNTPLSGTGVTANPALSTNTESGERGNIMVLSIVLGVVVLALVLTFASITQIQIERKRLLALADSAAAYAASAIDEEKYFAGIGAVLTDTTVRESAHQYLGSLPSAVHSRFTQLTLSSPTTALDEQTAQVSLSAQVEPGFVPWALVPFNGFTIEVTSAARADVVR